MRLELECGLAVRSGSALVEDLGLVPGTHLCSELSVTPVLGDPASTSGFLGCTGYTDIQVAYTHKNESLKKHEIRLGGGGILLQFQLLGGGSLSSR